MKPKRIENRALLDTYHTMRCAACGHTPCDPARLKSKGAGGDDVPDNLMPLCRKCHTTHHAIGWARFAQMFPVIHKVLKDRGWFIDEQTKRLQRV